jgi:micrococcal nuclease
MSRAGLQAACAALATAIALLLGAGGADAAAAEERFEGVVLRVSDGDTVWVRPDPAPGAPRRARVKVRLVGLDAPERCQAHGEQARTALSALVLHRHVTVRRRATDDYGRALGTLWLDGRDVGAVLVSEGHAWSARWRGDAGPYAEEEARARRAARGLFAAPGPLPPRDFRRLHGPCDREAATRG